MSQEARNYIPDGTALPTSLPMEVDDDASDPATMSKTLHIEASVFAQ